MHYLGTVEIGTPYAYASLPWNPGTDAQIRNRLDFRILKHEAVLQIHNWKFVDFVVFKLPNEDKRKSLQFEGII